MGGAIHTIDHSLLYGVVGIFPIEEGGSCEIGKRVFRRQLGYLYHRTFPLQKIPDRRLASTSPSISISNE